MPHMPHIAEATLPGGIGTVIGVRQSGIRITFLTDIPTPYMLAVLAALARRCELTAIFCSASGTRAMGWRLPASLPFDHRIVGGLAIRRRTADNTDIYVSPRILATLARSRPDVVISGGFSVPSLYAALYCTCSDAGLVVHSDGTTASEASYGLGRMTTRRLLARLGAVAAGNSELACRRFIELGWPEERVFRAAHSTNLAPLHAVARTRCYGRDRRLRLLTVGRLIPRKGIDALLDAVVAARWSGADIELIVVGTGPEQTRLRRRATELALPVRWRGFVDQPGLPAVYADADAFAFPSLDEPFGIVLLEAAASGLPVVASPRAGATWDLVDDERTGFVVDPYDVGRHAEALARLAAEPQLREELGREAYRSTLDRTPEATARGYLEAASASLRSDAERNQPWLGGRPSRRRTPWRQARSSSPRGRPDGG
jgi:glycosyltransferase involved in cell wall biosynthesis